MLRHYLILARPFTLLTPAVGVAVGGYAACVSVPAANDTAQFPSLLGISSAALAIALGALAAALLNASSNALNQICDLKIDRIAKPRRPIPSGAISIPAAAAFTVITAILALALAVGASAHPATSALIYGAAALLTWAYSAPPFRLRRFGWMANLTIAIPRGLLLAAAGWTLVAPANAPDPWVIGMVPALFLLGAATTKDFADMEADRADGVRTLPVVLGPDRATRVMTPFLVFPFITLAGFGASRGLGLFHPVDAMDESTRRLMVPGFLDGTFDAANGWVLAALGLVLTIWGWIISRLLRRDPHALTTTENHPSWRHMYLLMLTYYAGVAASYAAA